MKKLATTALQRILKGTTRQSLPCVCPKCSEAFETEIEAIVVKDANILKAIDTLCRITGDFAPTKSAKLVANVDKYKLPSD